jgi:hypothetical protein
VVIAENRGSDPASVVDAARNAKAERKTQADKGEADAFDEVWVVFDIEGPQHPHRAQQARSAIKQAKDLGMDTAVSNPCFEFWLLLHFEWCVEMFVGTEPVYRRLKRHIPKYDKGENYYEIIRPHRSVAIERAKRVYRERFPTPSNHPCDCLPCTEIYRLVESLLH